MFPLNAAVTGPYCLVVVLVYFLTDVLPKPQSKFTIFSFMSFTVLNPIETLSYNAMPLDLAKIPHCRYLNKLISYFHLFWWRLVLIGVRKLKGQEKQLQQRRIVREVANSAIKTMKLLFIVHDNFSDDWVRRALVCSTLFRCRHPPFWDFIRITAVLSVLDSRSIFLVLGFLFSVLLSPFSFPLSPFSFPLSPFPVSWLY